MFLCLQLEEIIKFEIKRVILSGFLGVARVEYIALLSMPVYSISVYLLGITGFII